MRHRVAVVVVMLCACGCVSRGSEYVLRRVGTDGAGGGDAAISPDGTMFVASSRRSGNLDVWLYDLEGSPPFRLTEDPADDFEAQWSPDGERLAFTSTRGGGMDIWIMDQEKRIPHRLTHDDEDEEYPAWSPDGRSVAYTRGPWKHRDFYTVPSAGGEPTRVTRASGHAGACSFARDGGSLICHRYDGGDGDIFRLSIVDGKETALTVGRPWDYKPTMSPDGRWIAFSRGWEGPSHIWLASLGDGGLVQLTDGPHPDRWPSWSTSGDRLLFHRLVEEGTAILRLDPRTGSLQTLVREDERPGAAALDQTGERLAYCVRIDDRSRIRIRDLKTAQISDLGGLGAGEACHPRWSPVGDRLAFLFRTQERWEIALQAPHDPAPETLTAGTEFLHGIEGPLDWSPDGQRIAFKANTGAFESDLFLIEVSSHRISRLTEDSWWDESPAWTPDGTGIAFMSTRGGQWTWGLFRLDLTDGRIDTLASPSYDEKYFPCLGRDGTLLWNSVDSLGVFGLAGKRADGTLLSLQKEGANARWPSFSPDGRTILFTRVERRVEYWVAENPVGRGSPAHHHSSEGGLTAACTHLRGAERMLVAEAPIVRSPTDVFHR